MIPGSSVEEERLLKVPLGELWGQNRTRTSKLLHLGTRDPRTYTSSHPSLAEDPSSGINSTLRLSVKPTLEVARISVILFILEVRSLRLREAKSMVHYHITRQLLENEKYLSSRIQLGLTFSLKLFTAYPNTAEITVPITSGLHISLDNCHAAL